MAKRNELHVVIGATTVDFRAVLTATKIMDERILFGSEPINCDHAAARVLGCGYPATVIILRLAQNYEVPVENIFVV